MMVDKPFNRITVNHFIHKSKQVDYGTNHKRKPTTAV